MKQNYQTFNNNIFVVTNGFDGEIEETNNLDTTFSITHIGLMNADRNPVMLWKVLAEIILENYDFALDFQLKLIGKVDTSVKNDIEKFGLSKNVNLIDYVSHNEVVEFQKKSQVLLLIVNNVPSAKGIITGKIFEYLMAKRPILAIAPTSGDLAEILNNSNAGKVVGFNDEINLKNHILELYSQFKNGGLSINSKGINKFHRKELTKKVAEIINQITT